MLNLGGSSSSSSSQTLTNNVSVNPIFNAGGSNTASSGFDANGNTAKSDSTATVKDELTAAASLGLDGGTGGSVGLTKTDAQPTASTVDPAAVDPTTGTPTVASGNNSLLWVGAIVAAGVLWSISRKKGA